MHVDALERVCPDARRFHAGEKMPYNPKIHRRRSIRLQNYDYSQPGAYFLTICVQDRTCLFGDVVDGEMRLNDAGNVAQECWNAIPKHFPHVDLDAFVFMPNHVHGILVIAEFPVSAGAKNYSPPRGTSKTVGSVVRGFKIGVTAWMRSNTTIRDVWQRNYWEHIVRDETELNRIREYIVTNPVQWEMDRLHPDYGDGTAREKPAMFGAT
jgi:REP element-mobilizing transposase RayT